MMNQIGIISKIEDDVLWVSALSEKDLESGAGCSTGGCGSGCSCNVSGQQFRAANPKGMDLKIGDQVDVRVDSGDLWKGILKVFLLPLLSALFFYWAVPRLFSFPRQDWLLIAGAFLGIGFAWVLREKNSNGPYIDRKLNQ